MFHPKPKQLPKFPSILERPHVLPSYGAAHIREATLAPWAGNARGGEGAQRGARGLWVPVRAPSPEPATLWLVR